MTRLFVATYQFRSCGDVFTQGLAHAADALGLSYAHGDWTDPSVSAHVAAFRPDLLFVIHGRQFTRHRHTLLDGRAYRTAVWLLDEPYEVDETASWSGRYDHVFVNDPATLHRHERSSYLPVCYNPVLHFAPPGAERPDAVGFIGGGNAIRNQYLGALADVGLLTYAVGGPWSHSGVRAVCRSLNIPAAETPRRYQRTRIVLNIWREEHHYNREHLPATSLNPRVYEALACGSLVVSQWRPEIETLVPELPVFHTPTECLDVVMGLLADPERAERIRAACWARVQPHTYAARLARVLALCGQEAIPA